MGFKTILVCVDGSESSSKAADLAIEISKNHKSQLIAINVIVSQVGYSYSSGMFGLSTPSAINALGEIQRGSGQVVSSNRSASLCRRNQSKNRDDCKSDLRSTSNRRLCRKKQS